MYDIGLILTTGGAVDYTFTPGNASTFATANANIITLSPTSNAVTVSSVQGQSSVTARITVLYGQGLATVLYMILIRRSYRLHSKGRQ